MYVRTPIAKQRDEEKRRRADFVVDTSQGHDYSAAQVHAILPKVRDLFAASIWPVAARLRASGREIVQSHVCRITIMNQDLIAKEMTQIPAAIEEMWGKPPVLPTEDPKAYEKLCVEIAKSVGPADIIEWLWIKDICDLSWEIRRLRQFKVRVVQNETWLGTAVRSYGRIDTVLASVESRRNAVLREIERRRESVASRLRKASDDIIDGEFTESNPASESVETGANQAAVGKVGRYPTEDAA
jgi:hypothetical protein